MGFSALARDDAPTYCLGEQRVTQLDAVVGIGAQQPPRLQRSQLARQFGVGQAGSGGEDCR